VLKSTKTRLFSDVFRSHPQSADMADTKDAPEGKSSSPAQQPAGMADGELRGGWGLRA